jgi:hypothetical protein
VGEEMLMSRKMGSAVAVLAFLSLSTAGAVQARPIAFGQASPSSVAADLGRWLSSGLAAILNNKDGAAIDPNGVRKQDTYRIPGAGRQPGRWRAL